MSAVGACPLLIAIALVCGDVEQRDAGEVLTNLREHPAAIIFFDRLIVEYHQSDIWLNKNLATHVFVGSMTNQFPGPLDDSVDEIRQRLVVREKQHSGREASFLQIDVRLQSSAGLVEWH